MITTYTLIEIYNDLAITIEWLKTLKIKIDDTRIPETLKYTKYFAEEYPKYLNGEINEIKNNEESGAAINEATTLNLIRQSFYNTQSNKVKNKIRASILGCFNSIDEKNEDNSNHARNILFELELAAYLIASGYRVTNELEDVNYNINNLYVNIQCKRLLTFGGIEKQFNKAVSQLVTKNKITTDPNSFGFIALSLEKLFKMDIGITTVKDEGELIEDMDNTRNHMDNLIVPFWDNAKMRYKNKELKLVGMIYLYKKAIINLSTKRFALFRRFLYDIPDFQPNTPYRKIRDYIETVSK